jgi:hypothetical protein
VNHRDVIRAGHKYWEITGKVIDFDLKEVCRDTQSYDVDLTTHSNGRGTIYRVADVTEYITDDHETSNLRSNFRDGRFRSPMDQNTLNWFPLCESCAESLNTIRIQR